MPNNPFSDIKLISLKGALSKDEESACIAKALIDLREAATKAGCKNIEFKVEYVTEDSVSITAYPGKG